MSVSSVDPPPPNSRTPTADELFAGTRPIESAEDLAQPGVFDDDDELDSFLNDLKAMRHADLA